MVNFGDAIAVSSSNGVECCIIMYGTLTGSVTDLDLSISTSRIESNLQPRTSISGTLSLHARLSTVGIGKEALCVKR